MKLDNPDSIDQLLYKSTSTTELYEDLLNACACLKYRANNAYMKDLQFELHSITPMLHSIMSEMFNDHSKYLDSAHYRQLFNDYAQHKLTVLGCDITLHYHPETYILLVVTHTNAGKLNWFDRRWVLSAPWLTAKLELVS